MMAAGGFRIQGASLRVLIANRCQLADRTKEAIAKTRCQNEYPIRGVGKIVSPKVQIAARNRATLPGKAKVLA
jgi:hypothetical protein